MIYGIGTDIVAVNRIRKIYSKFPEQLINKTLSSKEQEIFNNISNFNKKISFIATRWAGKEAVAKAFGIGLRSGLYLSQITITNNELGQPIVDLSDYAENCIRTLLKTQSYKIHISLSNEHEYVSACALIEQCKI